MSLLFLPLNFPNFSTRSVIPGKWLNIHQIALNKEGMFNLLWWIWALFPLTSCAIFLVSTGNFTPWSFCLIIVPIIGAFARALVAIGRQS